MQLYVENLNFSTTDQTLTSFFESAGEVLRTNIIKDQETGNSKGFAFIEMARQSEGLEAIEKLNGLELEGRQLNINQARTK